MTPHGRAGLTFAVALSFVVLSLSPTAGAQVSGARGVSLDPAAMAQAFPDRGLAPAKAADAQLVAARDLAAKALGEDTRDLVFVPITPCTVWDTRFASAPPSMGAIGEGETRKFYSHLDGSGGDFTVQGGNPACTEANQTFLGGRPFAVMMTIYVNNPTGEGWLTFYRDGDPDPSQATISVYYSPGPTRTQTVVSKSSRGYGTGVFDVAVTGRYATADASASVVGYFIRPTNITLPASTASTGNILKGANRFIHNYGAFNTFIGENAGNFAMTGQYNTGSGYGALTSTTSEFDNYNTASGAYALSNAPGGSGTASGAYALASGRGNNASGYYALSLATFGNNTADGAQALRNHTNGHSNSASGAEALFSNITGIVNTASGVQALYSNTTGGANTASGISALYSNTTGGTNTATGAQALWSNTTGSYNIAIGYQAGFNLTTGNYNIAIGNPAVAGEANTVRIGDSTNHTRTFIAGVRGVTTGLNDSAAVFIDGAGQLGTLNSSHRFKDDIADMGGASSALMKLRPVTFHYKTDQDPAGRRLQYGLIAEEVAQVYPGLVAHSADGQVETVMYQFLPAMLLNEYQKRQRTMDAQAAMAKQRTARIAELDEERKAQVARIEELEKQVAKVAALDQDRNAQAAELAALKQLTAEIALAIDRLRPHNISIQQR